MKVLNAFSLNMLDLEDAAEVTIVPADAQRIMAALVVHGIESCVGHADTAALFSAVLGIDIPMNRVTVVLERNQPVVVGQYVGPRLPEGTCTLPEGAEIKWLFVTVR